MVVGLIVRSDDRWFDLVVGLIMQSDDRQEENRKLLHAFETGGGNEHEGSLVWDVGDDQEDIEHKAVAGSRLRSMGCREQAT